MAEHRAGTTMHEDTTSEGLRRRFQDEQGDVWVAEVKRPRTMVEDGSTPMILFWTETRACLASLRSNRPFMELSLEELREHLRVCLSR
ncbi:MAG TPA: hypothetical protein VK966_00075 [Longimicrobiales bacterium]|nr:hypothetical protein [Longimicrobiales bacterium]